MVHHRKLVHFVFNCVINQAAEIGQADRSILVKLFLEFVHIAQIDFGAIQLEYISLVSLAADVLHLPYSVYLELRLVYEPFDFVQLLLSLEVRKAIASLRSGLCY